MVKLFFCLFRSFLSAVRLQQVLFFYYYYYFICLYLLTFTTLSCKERVRKGKLLSVYLLALFRLNNHAALFSPNGDCKKKKKKIFKGVTH